MSYLSVITQALQIDKKKTIKKKIPFLKTDKAIEELSLNELKDNFQINFFIPRQVNLC